MAMRNLISMCNYGDLPEEGIERTENGGSLLVVNIRNLKPCDYKHVTRDIMRVFTALSVKQSKLFFW